MLNNDIEIRIVPPVRDLGDGFQVRRALPSARRQMVGPFIFLDQMGPVGLDPGRGLDVRPHPHIGLATVTYLFEGEILHRDSLGNVQPIRPGEVNWMTAGSGIVHSERTPPGLRPVQKNLSGIQAWVALPRNAEEIAPAFAHVGSDALPLIDADGVHARIIAGAVHGAHADVSIPADLFYADVTLDPGARLALDAHYEERGAYVVEGTLQVEPGDESCPAGELVVFRPGARLTLAASPLAPVRFMLLGGAPVQEPRYIWWNFVSSSKERIEQAKSDWKQGRFAPVPDETEFIPLPEPPPPKVDYP
ncbi:MAG: pirin family protein [Rhodospirillaceae bacterium]